MPGIPSAVTDIFAQIEALSKVKPKTEAEAAGLEQAKQQLMNEAQRVSEGMDQMDPGSREPQNDGFTGRIDGKVFDAPWRGEFDMPGNFERRQRMSNSLAEDAFLGAGLGSSYEFDPNTPMEGKIISSSPAMAANAPELMNSKEALFMGPPEVSKYGMPGDTARLNKGKMLTEDQLKNIERMLRGGRGMSASADRLYGDNEVYQWMKQQGAGG
jgi:hypothetical protein